MDRDCAAVIRWLLLLPLLFLAAFFLYPLAAVTRRGLAGGLSGPLAVISDGYYAELLWFTTWQAALSTLLTLALALPGAYVFARYEFRGKVLLRALATVPFVLPIVVVAAAFAALLGPRGLLNTVLQTLSGLQQPPIQLQQSLAIILIAHVFYNYAVVLRLVGGFWANLDPQLDQAAAVLGAGKWRRLLRVSLPLLTPALGAAALLVFLFTFTSFGVILVLGGPRFATIEVEIYRQTAQLLRLDIAATLALIQLACTLLCTLCYSRLAARMAVPLNLRPRSAGARRPQGRWARLLLAANIVLIGLLCVAPLAALLLRSVTSLDNGALTMRYFRALSENPTGSVFYVPPLEAIRNSLLFALLSTAAALLLGSLAAYLLVGAGPLPKDSRLSRLLDALFTLPLGASPVTLGLGLLIGLSLAPLAWLRTSPLLVPVAHTLVALPFVVRALLPVLRGLNPRMREAGATLGARPGRVWRRIELPLIFPGLLSGAIFAFTVSLGEFGATLLVARPDYPTVPLLIFRLLGQPGALNYGQAMALSSILLLITATGFVLLERFRYGAIGEF
jgi:thiamine transport system permease protein